MTAFRLFTLHCVVHGNSPYQERPRSKSRHVSQSLVWLERQGFIVREFGTWSVTKTGKAAHDSDPGLYL